MSDKKNNIDNEGLRLLTKSVKIEDNIKEQKVEPKPQDSSLTQQIELKEKGSSNIVPIKIISEKIEKNVEVKKETFAAPFLIEDKKDEIQPMVPFHEQSNGNEQKQILPSIMTLKEPNEVENIKISTDFKQNLSQTKDDGIKIEFTPAFNAQPNAMGQKFAVKKTSEQIAAENAQMNAINATGTQSINNQLGVFTKKADIKPNEDKQLVTENVEQKNSEEEKSKIRLNFEKFIKDRKPKTVKTSAFGEKVNIMLRSKKGLKWTWIIELLVIAVMLAVGITFICLISPNLKTQYTPEWAYYQGVGTAGVVFSYITTCSWALPFIFLITAWFVGINDVAKSKGFHYFMWGMGAINILLFLVQMITSLIALVGAATFHM